MDKLRLKYQETVAGAPRRARAPRDRTCNLLHGPRRSLGIVINARAHRSRASGQIRPPAGLKWCSPDTLQDLSRRLAAFAREGVETLVVDGGDGTVRDVLSLAPQHFARGLPRIAIVPSGKTNALALDASRCGRRGRARLQAATRAA
jgi:predicted polyphosphate/ATP-dependent NAD kinase